MHLRGLRRLWQAGHEHHVSRNGYDETGAAGEMRVGDGERPARRRAEFFRIIG